MDDRSDRDISDSQKGIDPIQDNPLAKRQAHGRLGPDRGEDPAAGTAAEPVSPGEFQAGDRSELGQNLGGPVDISPIRGRRQIERPEE
jgi:hypothetical protein